MSQSASWLRYDDWVPSSADAELVDRLRRCDRSAFRELYARFAGPTFNFLVRLCGRRDLAEDLHQEVWLSIARHAARLTPDTDLAAWIFTVSRNRFVSSRRRSSPEVPTEVPDCLASRAAEPGETALEQRDIERALAALPPPHREVLLLVAVEGLAIQQAASVLKIRPDAARQRLSRARAALSQALAERDATGGFATPLKKALS